MRRFKLLMTGLAVVSLLAVPAVARADVNTFTVTSFAADETLSRADPQGELRVVERINVQFTDHNHGLLRAIPNRYKKHSLQLHVNSIQSTTHAPIEYTTYGSGGNTVLKIGDPDRTVTGLQEYTIDYTLHNVISFYPDHDELYWDVNGDQWQQSFNHVTAILHIPAELGQTKPPLCYAGNYGAIKQQCSVVDAGNTIRAVTLDPLSTHQTLTYVAAFQKGYFKPAKWYETVGEYWQQIAGVLLPIVVLGAGSAWYWWRKGRDAKGTGIIVPHYDAPDGLKPIVVGALVDFKVDNRDITATIIDLAVRGYIKIIENKKQRIGKDKLSYILQLEKIDFSELDPNETALLTTLFSDLKSGAQTDLSASKNKLYKTAAILKKNIRDALKTDGYFRRDPLSAGAVVRSLLWIAVLVVAGAILFVMAGPIFLAGLGIGLLIALPFWLALDARTAKGVVALEHILGLKLYLEVAEKDRLKKLQAPDAKYAANATEPVRTVELYEKLLPYAMVLGVEKQWSKQFEHLYTSPPDWYSGNWTTFNAVYLASSLNDGIGSAINTAFSAPSSSGSSGFGGGFSGGGGGGGGGGGW